MRSLLRAAFALALAAALAAPAAAATKLIVSYTSAPDFAGVFVAKERGFFAKHGLDVTLQLIPVAPNVPAAVMSNSVQIGGTTPSVLLQAVDSGLDLVAVAGGGVQDSSQGQQVGVVARSGLAVKAAQDLVGKKVGVPGFGAAIHLYTRRWLMSSGVDPKKVTFVEVPIPQMADVLKGGSIDAVAAPEPFVSRMVQAQIGSNVPAFQSAVADGVSTCMYVTTRPWALANTATVKAFREAVAEGVAFAKANKEAALGDIGKYFKVPPQLLQSTPFPNLQPVLKDEQLRFWADVMRTQDMLKRQAPLSSVILK
jgi:NitT/TauT family transport system substrate-binding protein